MPVGHHQKHAPGLPPSPSAFFFLPSSGIPPAASRATWAGSAVDNSFKLTEDVSGMSKVITPHFEKLIDRFVASGRFNNKSEVIRAGLRLLEEHEATNAAASRDDLTRHYPDCPHGPASPDSSHRPSPTPPTAMKGLPVLIHGAGRGGPRPDRRLYFGSRPSRGGARQGHHRPAKPSAWNRAGERNGFERATQ